MRGNAARQVEMLTAVTPDALIPQGHPIGRIKPMVDKALAQLSPTFARRYAQNGRALIPPEHLLKAGLLMALYSVRRERQFCERLEYDLLFKWFLDLNIMDHSFDHSVFAKNRQRLLDADVGPGVSAADSGAGSGATIAVGGSFQRRRDAASATGIDEAWASLQSFRPRDEDPPPSAALGDGGGGRNREVDFRGERRRNETHRSTTDPEARLARKGKGKEARLCFGAHVLMDNREGLVVDVRLTPADGAGERDAAVAMLASAPGTRRITVGADRGYDTRGFVRACRNEPEGNAAGGPEAALGHRQTHHSPRWLQGQGYRFSQRARKRIEEVFGWVKTVGGGRKLRYRGLARNRLWAEMTIAGYNLVRLAKLTAATA